MTFVNGKFVPIAGRSAFLSRKILLATPLREMATGASVTYRFSNALIYNNATTAIKSLVVYFNDTTPISIINNGILILPTKIVNYDTSGIKTLKFVATFTDDTTITTVGYHYFAYSPISTNPSLAASSIPCTDNLKDRGIYKSTIDFQGYDENVGYYGKFDYTVFYHQKNLDGTINTTQKRIVKPIIIIDGFDPGDKRKTTDCDCEQDTSEGGCFQKNSENGVFNPTSHESIEDNMQYNDVNTSGDLEPKNLITKLRDEGYDVVILNIPKYYTSAMGSSIENKLIDGGADYVERNGRALASYIKSTKLALTLNGSTEGLVIMGPSMGGLISRYALAYMEKKFVETNDVSWKHNTRLWVSFDSPHLGANIPLGAQANIWFFGEKLRNSKAEEKFNNELNSTAGKQMIIGQFQHFLNTMNNGTGNPNNSPFFNQFYSNLNSNGVAGSGGFPESIPGTFRKIAIVNGSLDGSKNGIESGEFLNIRGFKDPTITEGIIAGAVAGSVLPFVGTFSGAVFGGLLGATNANVTVLRVRDKFFPAYGQTDDIFNGDGQNFDIGWNHWNINHKWYNFKGANNDIRGSLDIVPAGTFTTAKILKEEIVSGLDKAGMSNEVRGTYIETHSFIPTFSSLGHLSPGQNWSNPLNVNLACPLNKLTPFDSYFGISSNSGHITLTKEMVTWLLKELAGNPQAPWFPIQANLLTGENVICQNQPKTYSIADICKVPSPVKYNDQNGNPVNGWSVTGNLQIVSSTPYTVTVQGTSNAASEGKIIATFHSFVGGQKIEKIVHIGAPSVSNLRIGGTFDWVSTYSGSIGVGVVPDPTATSYIWSVSYDPIDSPVTCPAINPRKAKFLGGTTVGYVNSLATTSPNVSIDYGNCVGSYMLTCTAVNACGGTAYIQKETTVGPPSANPCIYKTGLKLSIAPNPIKDGQINVILSKTIDMMPCNYLNNGNKQIVQLSNKDEIIENKALIYDLFGNLVYSKMFNTDEFTLTDINLKRGHYILNVFTSKGESSKQVIIVE